MQKMPSNVVSHWNHLIENFQTSPKEFYVSVERAIAARNIPETKLSQVDWREGGMFSGWREYLRVTRGKYVLDICGAPFGTGFFVSSWLVEAPALTAWQKFWIIAAAGTCGAVLMDLFGPIRGAEYLAILIAFLPVLARYAAKRGQVIWDDRMLEMPILGRVYDYVFRPQTYYRMDTALMFQEATHNAVQEAVKEMTSAKGVRALSELEQKPILRAFAAHG